MKIIFFDTSGGGIVGAKLCFLLNILWRLLSSFFFFRQHSKALHIREQQFLRNLKTIKLEIQGIFQRFSHPCFWLVMLARFFSSMTSSGFFRQHKQQKQKNLVQFPGVELSFSLAPSD